MGFKISKIYKMNKKISAVLKIKQVCSKLAHPGHSIAQYFCRLKQHIWDVMDANVPNNLGNYRYFNRL